MCTAWTMRTDKCSVLLQASSLHKYEFIFEEAVDSFNSLPSISYSVLQVKTTHLTPTYISLSQDKRKQYQNRQKTKTFQMEKVCNSPWWHATTKITILKIGIGYINDASNTGLKSLVKNKKYHLQVGDHNPHFIGLHAIPCMKGAVS